MFNFTQNKIQNYLSVTGYLCRISFPHSTQILSDMSTIGFHNMIDITLSIVNSKNISKQYAEILP